jgi:hypothetical protein
MEIGLQFHPEVTHSGSAGRTLLRNFVVNICGASATWNMSNIADKFIQQVCGTQPLQSKSFVNTYLHSSQVRDRVGEESHVIGAVVGSSSVFFFFIWSVYTVYLHANFLVGWCG